MYVLKREVREREVDVMKLRVWYTCEIDRGNTIIKL